MEKRARTGQPLTPPPTTPAGPVGRSAMELIYFPEPGGRYPDDIRMDGVTYHAYSDYAALPEAVSPGSVFVLSLADRDSAYRLLHALRQDPRTGLQPVFTTTAFGFPLDQVSDGRVESALDAYTRARAIVDRLGRLDESVFAPGASDQLRILGYLYSRPELHLVPQRLWSSEGFYSYPVLEAMLGTPQLVAARLLALCDRKLLRRGQLNDRVRHCPACDGAHLNFVDLCPNCRHLDIVQQPFLHCFTCGAVAPEERFVDQDGLRCPNCYARLRHIGTDYDRPLENFSCTSCGHTFIEPEVQARCMHCTTLTPPDRLTPRTVCTYELTDLGVQAAESGTMEDVFALLDTVNSVSPTYFLNLVNWLLALARRHQEERFTIIGLRLQNMVELNARLGQQPVLDMMDTLATRLRELVRSTDLSTRTGQQMFWLLLPKTGQAQHRIVLDRILALRNLLPDGDGIDFETVVFSAPEDMQPDETGKLLLARLEGELA